MTSETPPGAEAGRPGLLAVDFGGPQGPDELEPFLAELLTDVLPGPRWLRQLLGPVAARRRAPTVKPAYERIGWSPLVRTHLAQVEALTERLDRPELPVASGMMFTPPTMLQALRSLLEQDVDTLVVLPLFPHFSFATTNAAFTFLREAMVAEGVGDLPVAWIPAWFDHPLYIRALARTIRAGVDATPGEGPIHLLFSPHGLPVSWVTKRRDPYPNQIRETVRRAVAELGWTGPWHIGWQSRVGPVRWLEPSTPQVLDDIAAVGAQRVTVVPVSFMSEHIETLDEIDNEYAAHAIAAGIPHFGRAPTPGLDVDFIGALADIVHDALAHLDRHRCVRCLVPRDEAHRTQSRCLSCHFQTPGWQRLSALPQRT